MNWAEAEIQNDEDGRPMFKGALKLSNDKRERLGGIVWFRDDGPFYASAMDAADPQVMRRIGPCSTLDGAKQAVLNAIEGLKNISDRAGYRR